MRGLRAYLLGVVFMLSACAPRPSDDANALVVAMDPAIGSPFVYQAATEQYGGFEVDLCKYLAEKLKRPLKIQSGQWSELPELVRRKKVDLVLNAIEKPVTGHAPKALSFTEPYYTAYQKLAVHNDDNYTYNLSDLKAKKVGVVLNSIGALLLAELNRLKKSEITIVTYTTPDELFAALASKEVTATLTERAVASWYAWKNKQIKLTGDAITTPLPYVALVRTENTELLKAVNAVLKTAGQDPAFQAIFDKWHVSIKR
jgi:arginine/lysine/histidine transporter system substrate-binding protein